MPNYSQPPAAQQPPAVSDFVRPQQNTTQSTVSSKIVLWGGMCFLLLVGLSISLYVFWSHKKALGAELDEGMVFANRITYNEPSTEKKSGLFDIASVNKSLRARGLATETVTDSAGPVDEDARRAPALNRPTSGLNAEMQAKQLAQNTAEVYFGEDAAVAARLADQQAGGVAQTGSSETVRLLPQTDIAGAANVNELDWAVYKATRMSAREQDKAFNQAVGDPLAPGRVGVALPRGKKATEDLAQAWLLSEMAVKQHSPLAQKQMAAAGAMAGALPQDGYAQAEEGSSVRVRGTEKIGDKNKTHQIVQKEKQCELLSEQANKDIAAKLTEAETLIRTLRSTIPTTCGAVAAWQENLRQVKSTCQAVRASYAEMQQKCALNVRDLGRCESVALDTYAADWTAACEALQDARALPPSVGDKEEKIAAAEQAIVYLTKKGALSEKDVVYAFNLEVDGQIGQNDFFPSADLLPRL